jgi:hypothetical protein
MNEADIFFEKRGWRKIRDDATLPVYVNDYAAVGFSVAAKADEIIDGWAGWQTVLLQLRKQPDVGYQRDLYLIILLGDEDPEILMSLQPIIDDTHVCRKIVFPQRGRTITETLIEEPLFQVVGATATDADTSAQINDLTLDNQVITDLAKKSALTIFDRLLAGQYRRTDET